MNPARLLLPLPLLLLALLLAGCTQTHAPEPTPTPQLPAPTETASPRATLVPKGTALPSPVVRVRDDRDCATVSIDLNTVEQSTCANETAVRLPMPEQRHAELVELQETFASFERPGEDGALVFNGAGKRTPSLAEQRSIETWARLALDDARAGQTSPAAGLVIDWRMDGGDVAYFCGQAKVYITGFAYASVCSTEETARDVMRIRLSAEQVAQVLAWSETYQGFGDWVTDNPMSPGAMTHRLTFTGQGSQMAGEDVKEAAMKLGSGVFYTMFSTRYGNTQ